MPLGTARLVYIEEIHGLTIKNPHFVGMGLVAMLAADSANPHPASTILYHYIIILSRPLPQMWHLVATGGYNYGFGLEQEFKRARKKLKVGTIKKGYFALG